VETEISCFKKLELRYRGLYVAAFIELFSRRVVGWSMKGEMPAGLVRMRMSWRSVGRKAKRFAAHSVATYGLAGTKEAR
jgi:hypothetical protein